jgi:EpsD family peptidyl-prolyl cis-trans isomerase
MRHLVLVTTAALALSACGKSDKPEGQVIAKVNGTEITRPELNAALPRTGATASKEQNATTRNAVLDQLVMQELVAQEAREQGIDKTQAYLIASRRAQNQILSDLLSQRVLRDLRTPYATNVADYIRTNPTRFEQRELIQVEQIRFPAGSGISEAQLRAAPNLDAVAALLTRAKIRSARGRAAIDTLTLDPPALRQILSVPAGRPFVINENGLTIASVIVARRPAPITGEEAKKVALDQLTQTAGRDALIKQLELLRRKAKIEYQNGFAAPRPLPGMPTAQAAAK